MAVVLAVRPSVASHWSAGWLWGLLRGTPGMVHVTAPTPRRQRRGFVVHCAPLQPVDLTWVDEVPVTSPPRTYLDLAAILDTAGMNKVLERAEELELFDLGPVEELLARAAGHRGLGQLDRALTVYRPEPAFTRSRLERRFLELVREAGLPAPSVNFVVAGYEIDACWEAERFGVELDVYETHGSHAAFERDRQREDDLMLAGVETIRVTGPRLRREPRATIERVAAHLARRRRELAARAA